MTTQAITITTEWQRIVSASGGFSRIDTRTTGPIEIGASTDDDAPDAGHLITADRPLTRAEFGPGAVWARIAPESAALLKTADIVVTSGDAAADPINTPGAVVADDGVTLPLASLAQSLSYNPDGTLSHVEVTHDGAVYRQSMTWADGKLVAVSVWEVQP